MSTFNQYSTSINYYVQRTKASGDNKACDFWSQILSSERIAGTTFNTYGSYLKAAWSNFIVVYQGKQATHVSIQNPGGFWPTKQLDLAISHKPCKR